MGALFLSMFAVLGVSAQEVDSDLESNLVVIAEINNFDNARGNAVEFVDVNADGNLDLFLANSGPDALYWGDGNGGFNLSNQVFGSGKDISEAVAWGDYDNDEDLDLVVGNAGGYSHLYQQQDDGSFLRVGEVLDHKGFVDEVSWHDFDRNGTLDLTH